MENGAREGAKEGEVKASRWSLEVGDSTAEKKLVHFLCPALPGNLGMCRVLQQGLQVGRGLGSSHSCQGEHGLFCERRPPG